MPTPASIWIALAALGGGPRQEVGVAAVDATVYVSGGFGGPDRVEVYDVASNTWRSAANLPKGRNHVGAAAVSDHVYVICGFDGSGFTAVKDVYRFDAGAWSAVAPLPRARGALTVAEVDGKLHAIGGDTRLGSVTDHDVYDPTTDAWTGRAPLPSPRNHLAAATIDGRVYAVGGRGGPNTAELDRYDPATDTWEVRADADSPQRARGGGAEWAVGSSWAARGIRRTRKACFRKSRCMTLGPTAGRHLTRCRRPVMASARRWWACGCTFPEARPSRASVPALPRCPADRLVSGLRTVGSARRCARCRVRPLPVPWPSCAPGAGRHGTR